MSQHCWAEFTLEFTLMSSTGRSPGWLLQLPPPLTPPAKVVHENGKWRGRQTPLERSAAPKLKQQVIQCRMDFLY